MNYESLRQYCGGYHAKNAWVCMISSFVTLVLAVWIAMQDIDCSVYRISVIVAIIIIVKNSPIESENRKLDEDEKIVYLKKAIILACFIVFIIVVFDIIGLNKYSDAIGIGTVLVAVSQLLYMIRNYENYV